MGAERIVSWSRVSAVVAERLGLHFPGERLAELQRGLRGAAGELGLASAGQCANRLLSARLDQAQVEVIASHLTIGETYFFRGDETFAALAQHVLPRLISARRGGSKRLRLWSAGCCSGEEAYSLAILVRQLLPDLEDWDITILATDINPRFLRKAADGIYGEWSFRGTPTGFRERHFQRTRNGRYSLRPEIKRMVEFAPLNLVGDISPALAARTAGMDLVLCRNVLMYFTPGQARRVVANLHRSLGADGWLVVAPCEVSQDLFARFAPVVMDGAILYRRQPEPAARTQCGRVASAPVAPAVEPVAPASAAAPQRPHVTNARLTHDPRKAPATRPAQPAGTGVVGIPIGRPETDAGVRDVAARARRLADQGRLSEALDCCDRWIGHDKLDAAAHHLRAMVLIERNEPAEARAALQRAVYLDPGNIMSCLALGNLERGLGHGRIAVRHYRTTLALLEHAPPEHVVNHSEGATVLQLKALVRDLLAAERDA